MQYSITKDSVLPIIFSAGILLEDIHISLSIPSSGFLKVIAESSRVREYKRCQTLDNLLRSKSLLEVNTKTKANIS